MNWELDLEKNKPEHRKTRKQKYEREVKGHAGLYVKS